MPVKPVSVSEALELQRSGVLLLDIREPDEWAVGLAEGARPVSRAELEKNACRYISGFDQPVMLLCAGGKRSDACAQALTDAGYITVFSVQGGIQSWLAAGLPAQAHQASDFDRRYSRQMVLPQIGREGQEKLSRARILLVGAGGLGSPAGFYLAAAGVGYLRIVDDDTVDVSNLQRQILHKNDNVGELKIKSAKSTLNSLNPSISIELHNDKITRSNIIKYLNNIDLVIDGTDNFKARYAISDACAEAGIPWAYGAVYRFEGQVSLFHASRPEHRGLCYRCLFPELDSGLDAPNCSEAGVLGVAPGIIGVLQATEALKFLLGIGQPMIGRLLHVDLLGMHFHETKLTADPECAACGSYRTPQSLSQ
ncbi:MAG: molybdopterin-synthase adenylyltransferase MoeB [Arenimonas sp.]|nr:molybdopterin-synthase adenylyltransferase MoeB [Arenimonas sp.]